MNFAWRIASFLVMAVVAAGQSKSPNSRSRAISDMKKIGRTVTPATIPRGYALIVGVAGYKNLPASAQLEYSERDADSIYSVLISPKAGTSAPRMFIG